MLGITKHAHLHLWARDVRQLNRAAETLVLLWVVVLQTNLKLNGLGELPILLLGIPNDLGDGILESLGLQLTAADLQYGKYTKLILEQSTVILALDSKSSLAQSNIQLSLLIRKHQRAYNKGQLVITKVKQPCNFIV